MSFRAKEGGPCKYHTKEGAEITCEKLITLEDSSITRLEFSRRNASRAHVSSQSTERPELLAASLACKLTGIIPKALRRSSTSLDIVGDIIDTLCPLAVSSLAKYKAGRMDPSKSIIMSQTSVKFIRFNCRDKYKLSLSSFYNSFDETRKADQLQDSTKPLFSAKQAKSLRE